MQTELSRFRKYLKFKTLDDKGRAKQVAKKFRDTINALDFIRGNKRWVSVREIQSAVFGTSDQRHKDRRNARRICYRLEAAEFVQIQKKAAPIGLLVKALSTI